MVTSLMKLVPYTQLFAVALATALASCSPTTPDTTRVLVSASLGRDSSLAGNVFTDVNAYRNKQGMKTLQRHSGLDRLAQEHCEYLAKIRGSEIIGGKTISHIGFEGRALVARQVYQIGTVAENVVSSGRISSGHLVELWAGSKSHEHTMRSDWSCTGVGTVVTDDGVVISTQLFGTEPRYGQLEMANRYNRRW